MTSRTECGGKYYTAKIYCNVLHHDNCQESWICVIHRYSLKKSIGKILENYCEEPPGIYFPLCEIEYDVLNCVLCDIIPDRLICAKPHVTLLIEPAAGFLDHTFRVLSIIDSQYLLAAYTP